jgi:aspartate/methionine/tyrosine aminotransferase
VVPPGLTADLGKLIEYNTSCAPVFVQRAGIAAVKEGEPVIARTPAVHRTKERLVDAPKARASASARRPRAG